MRRARLDSRLAQALARQDEPDLLCSHFVQLFNCHRRAFARRPVGQGRLELPTPRLSSACSNQLSYEPKVGNWRSTCLGPCFGGADEIRTRDPLLAKQVLYQLSYDPIQVKTVMLKELAYQNLLCAIN